MVSSEPTWHMSRVQKRVSKFVNFKVKKVQIGPFYALPEHTPEPLAHCQICFTHASTGLDINRAATFWNTDNSTCHNFIQILFKRNKVITNDNEVKFDFRSCCHSLKRSILLSSISLVRKPRMHLDIFIVLGPDRLETLGYCTGQWSHLCLP